METSKNLYRLFSVKCSREKLIELSEWLNSNLDFDDGEDFDKVSEQPLDCNIDFQLCKTTRKDLVTYLRWAADMISTIDGLKPKEVNRVRIIKVIAQKIEKTIQKEDND